MKKLLPLALCLVLLAGCALLSACGRRATEAVAVPTDKPTAAPIIAAEPVSTPLPVPGVTREPILAPTFVPKPAETAGETSLSAEAPAPTPVPTATAAPTPVPTPTVPPLQTYAGTYFRFDAPGHWLKAAVPGGVYFYPDQSDIQHTFLCYQEAGNEMGLSEASIDFALFFSSGETVTAMVEGALTESGMTDFKLSPVDVRKTKLNGSTCYRGASDIQLGGETFDFVGYIFLRGEKMVQLIWVGDQAKHAEGLKTIYDSLQALR